MSRIVTSLWFDKEAREAVEFYVSVIPNSTLTRTTVLQAETPSGPPGSVSVIDFTLDGRAFSAMEARAMSSFNHSVSITVLCDSQDEIIKSYRSPDKLVSISFLLPFLGMHSHAPFP